jgi:hypothetical protein
LSEAENDPPSEEEEKEATEPVAVAAAGPQKRGPNWLRYNSKRNPYACDRGGIRCRDKLTGIDQPVFQEMRKLQRST